MVQYLISSTGEEKKGDSEKEERWEEEGKVSRGEVEGL